MSWSIYSFYSHLSYFRLACAIFSTFQGILMTLLNFYWYYFVIKKMIRTIKELKTKDSDDDFKTSGRRANIDDDYCMDQERNA